MYGNRRGPRGQGPKSGRGMGLCNGNEMPGYMNDHWRGRRQGFHHHHGHGRRCWDSDYPRFGRGFRQVGSFNNPDEKEYLGEEIKIREDELLQMKNRFEELETEKKEDPIS